MRQGWSLATLLGIVLLVGLAACFRAVRVEEVFAASGINFLDTDCYTRMHRVQMLADAPFMPVRWHDFENYPDGIRSHATAPLDYSILVLSWVVKPFTSRSAIEMAGALVSPLSGVLLMFYLAWWLRREFGQVGMWAGLTAYTIIPPLAWAQNVGRPDHQSLIVFFLVLAVTLEWGRFAHRDEAEQIEKDWGGVASGVAWGMALWVSFFEPLVLFALVSFAQIVLLRKKYLKKQLPVWLSLLGVLAVAFAVERFSFSPVPPELKQDLLRWLHWIGELQGLSFLQFTYWFGGWPWAIFLVGIFGAWGLRNPESACEALGKGHAKKAAWVVAGFVTLAVWALSMWQLRWAPFLGALLAVFWIPMFFRLPGQIWQVGVAIIFTIPILFYYHHTANQQQPQSVPYADTRLIAKKIAASTKPGEPAAILAPWWLSPSLLYHSRCPIVASSSHQSIGGIVASSRFLISSDWTECERILKEKNVRWIVTGEPGQMISQSARILGMDTLDEHQIVRHPSYPSRIGVRLSQVRQIPTVLRLRAVVNNLKLYEYMDAKL